MNEFGELLRKRRRECGITQREMAERLGRSPAERESCRGLIGAWEASRIPPPLADRIHQIAIALGLEEARESELRAAAEQPFVPITIEAGALFPCAYQRDQSEANWRARLSSWNEMSES